MRYGTFYMLLQRPVCWLCHPMKMLRWHTAGQCIMEVAGTAVAGQHVL